MTKIERLLYRSFDAELSSEEQAILDQALTQSAELRVEKERLEKMRSQVQASGEKAFHPFFAEKVMSRLRDSKQSVQEDAFFNALVSLFRPIVIGSAILFLGLISYNIIRSGEISLASAFAEPQVTLEQVIDPALSLKLE
ncbi:hypothetical protein GF337_05165 [candidate division KSB1 bacterium]|nr:hypothetical protein [candidate division KSB1 bacterium]